MDREPSLRVRGYDAAEKEALYQTIAQIVDFEFGRPDMPVLANLDFGHTEPQWVLPFGVRAEIDAGEKTFRLVEPAVT